MILPLVYPDMTEAERRDDGRKSYDLAISVLRARREAEIGLAQRSNIPSASEFPSTSYITPAVLADTQVLASDSAMTARRETACTDSLSVSSLKLSDRAPLNRDGAVALSREQDLGAPASPSCARERSHEDTSPPFGLRPLAQTDSPETEARFAGLIG